MRSTRILIIVGAICAVGLLGLGTLAQRGEQDRVFERDGTRVNGRLNSVDADHVVFNGKVIERSQVAMILFAGSMVPTGSPSSQQSATGTTDLVIMKNGDRSYGKVSRVTATTVVQNGNQLPRVKVAVIEFEVSPPGYIETVEPNAATPIPTPSSFASPSPPTSYIPAQEKPPGASPSPAGRQSPEKDQKKPTPKSECKNLLADLPPAALNCIDKSKLLVSYSGLFNSSRQCFVTLSTPGWHPGCPTQKVLGPKMVGPDTVGALTAACGSFFQEWSKKEGTVVCCDCEKPKPNPAAECAGGCQCCEDCKDQATEAFPSDSEKWLKFYDQCLVRHKCKEKCK